MNGVVSTPVGCLVCFAVTASGGNNLRQPWGLRALDPLVELGERKSAHTARTLAPLIESACERFAVTVVRPSPPMALTTKMILASCLTAFWRRPDASV